MMPASSRRSSWVALAGLGQAIGVLLLPKCPLCLAMDFGIVGSLVATFQARFGPLLWPSLALAAGSAAVLAVRFRSHTAAPNSRVRKTGQRLRPCCPPPSASSAA